MQRVNTPTYKDFEALIGKSAANRAVKAQLAKLGWKKAVPLAKGDWFTELAFDEHGIAVTFWVPNGKPVVAKNLVFHKVELRPPYAGVLPKKLTFDDDWLTAQRKGGMFNHSSRIAGHVGWAGRGPTIGVVFEKRKGRRGKCVGLVSIFSA